MTATDDQAISIRGLSKTFHVGLLRKRVQALQSLDLDVRRGEVFGFLGPNGAGKTTTIKILVGLLRADAGQVALLGRPISDVRSRAGVAYLPELPDLYDYLLPGELLTHLGELSGLDRATLRRRVPEVLEQVGLNPAERRPMRKFSKGMLQRVGIAQTLLADPELYILDEPQGGLDPLGRRWIKDLIQDLERRGKTVFFSSHVLAEAEAVCARVAFLYGGRRVFLGGLQELLHGSGPFEVLVEGVAALADPELGALASMRPAGADVLAVLPDGEPAEPFLSKLTARGLRLRAVNRRHTTLEDAFIRLVNEQKAEGKEVRP